MYVITNIYNIYILNNSVIIIYKALMFVYKCTSILQYCIHYNVYNVL